MEKKELEIRLDGILEKKLDLIPSYFDKKWEAVNNQEYGKRYSGSFRWKDDSELSEKKAGELEKEFGDSWKERPRFGYVRPYGDSNKYEDVATYVEAVISSPEIFAKLINPNSKYYDERYKKKIELLREYKFITDIQYNRVFRFAGMM